VFPLEQYDPRRSTRAALLALLVSGVLGFHLGYARFPDWQIPVESAQVLAGIVRYPDETPFIDHHMKLWTILHQICALLLKAGMSEIALSRFLSGALGMLSLQALAMFAYAFSGRALESAGVAVLLFVSNVTYAGAVYPIFLMGVPFTYGVVGLSLIVLVAALQGSGLHRSAAFLLGLSPAVHTGLAIWLWLTVAVSLMIDWKRYGYKRALPWFVFGVAVSAVSYGVYAAMSLGIPAHPVPMDRRYLDAFVTFWDGHRRPLAFREHAVLLNACALVIATVWLRWFRGELTENAAFLLRFVQVNAALAIAVVPLTWMPTRLPVALVVLMPGRLVNTVAMTFSAMLLGMLGTGASWRRVLMLLMAAALLLGDASLLWRFVAKPEWMPPIPTHHVAYFAAAALLIGALVERVRIRRAGAAVRPSLRIAVNAAFAIVLMASVAVAYRVPELRNNIYIDHTNNVVLARAAAGSGLLLTVGDSHLMQLRVRRPMLIDTGALDTIPYTPGSGPKLYRILLDIYGIDLFHPPPEQRHAGRLLDSVHKRTWEGYSVEDWRRIRRTYHVTEVLTPAAWQLNLPIISGDHRYLLYEMPEELPVEPPDRQHLPE
jgi:hypothetical protein